ncbi:DUF6112 family protein [Streptosporangium sp. CA-115845]|uniref:DUF6112 family protein n=1 Tax=Streptosporangium sp. CA-115845 TaxID=3240071 RepID=UPI003D8B937D
MDATAGDTGTVSLPITMRVSWAIASRLQRLLSPAPTPRPSRSGGTNLQDVPLDPDALPGAQSFIEIVGGLKSYGVLAALAGVVISAMVLGVGRWFGNPYASSAGRAGVFASLAAALVIGASGQLVEWAFNIGEEF